MYCISSNQNSQTYLKHTTKITLKLHRFHHIYIVSRVDAPGGDDDDQKREEKEDALLAVFDVRDLIFVFFVSLLLLRLCLSFRDRKVKNLLFGRVYVRTTRGGPMMSSFFSLSSAREKKTRRRRRRSSSSSSSDERTNGKRDDAIQKSL